MRVHAATVNRTDCAILRAKPWIKRLVTGLFRPRRPIPGTDFAGVVEAVGEHTQALKAGDAVFGFDDVGLCFHAEYMTFSEDDAVAIKPSDVSFAEAAASSGNESRLDADRLSRHCTGQPGIARATAAGPGVTRRSLRSRGRMVCAPRTDRQCS